MILDAALIDRLETTSAALTTRVAETMVSSRVPGAMAPVPWCGGVLIALGPGRYVNRAVGFGSAVVSAEQLGVAEEYCREAGVPSMIEVSTWASSSLIGALGDRRYRPSWSRNVYARPVDMPVSASGSAEPIDIRVVDDELLASWQRVLADGNGLTKDADRDVSDEFALARFRMQAGPNLLVFVDGEPAACGSLEVADGVGWVGGAATVPAFRGRGLQAALLDHRLRLAEELGCDLVAASALPAGVSARNLSRSDFSLAYTQTEFVRKR